MLTYNQWKKAVVEARVRECEVTVEEAEFGLSINDWWKQYVQPCLNEGKRLTLPVCRCLAKNWPFNVLAWIAKNWPGQMPRVYYESGKACASGQSVPAKNKREYKHEELFKG